MRRALPDPVRDAVARFDATADRVADRIRSPAADTVFYGLSSACDHGVLWHVLGALRAARTGIRVDALRFSGAMVIESFVTNVVVKTAVGRRRPARDDAPMPYGVRVPITSSFPSGHATAAFTAAVLLSRDGRGRTRWFALAAVVAASRVYVRLHHASDVVAGSAMGLALGTALRPLVPARRGMPQAPAAVRHRQPRRRRS
jgi:undecaprenyl-diphosphatase